VFGIDAGSSATGQYAATDFNGVTRELPPDMGAFENTTAS